MTIGYEEWQQDAIFSVYFSTSNEVISGFLPVQYSTGGRKMINSKNSKGVSKPKIYYLFWFSQTHWVENTNSNKWEHHITESDIHISLPFLELLYHTLFFFLFLLRVKLILKWVFIDDHISKGFTFHNGFYFQMQIDVRCCKVIEKCIHWSLHLIPVTELFKLL